MAPSLWEQPLIRRWDVYSLLPWRIPPNVFWKVFPVHFLQRNRYNQFIRARMWSGSMSLDLGLNHS